MAGSVNVVFLLGNVGKDPEIRQLNNGDRVASFSVATSESWKDKSTGEKIEKTEWHNVVCFNDGLCGVIESYVRKGSKVHVQGQIQTRKWQDQSGNDRYSTEIVISKFNGALTLAGDAGGSTGARNDDRAPARGAPGGGGNGYAQARDGGGSTRSRSFSDAGADLDDEIPF